MWPQIGKRSIAKSFHTNYVTAAVVGVIFQTINIKIACDNDFFIFIRKFFKGIFGEKHR